MKLLSRSASTCTHKLVARKVSRASVSIKKTCGWRRTFQLRVRDDTTTTTSNCFCVLVQVSKKLQNNVKYLLPRGVLGNTKMHGKCNVIRHTCFCHRSSRYLYITKRNARNVLIVKIHVVFVFFEPKRTASYPFCSRRFHELLICTLHFAIYKHRLQSQMGLRFGGA